MDRKIQDQQNPNCPCCDGNSIEYVKGGSIFIYCTSCGLQIERALVPSATWWDAVFSARDAWAKRVK